MKQILTELKDVASQANPYHPNQENTADYGYLYSENSQYDPSVPKICYGIQSNPH